MYVLLFIKNDEDEWDDQQYIKFQFVYGIKLGCLVGCFWVDNLEQQVVILDKGDQGNVVFSFFLGYILMKGFEEQ